MMSDKSDNASAILRDILVDALRVDPAEIVPEARIFGDLFAESIDLLDIQFQLERAFGLSLDQNELVENLGQGLSAKEIDERLTVQWCLDYIEHRLATEL
ncbi:MAG TPA: phosphopantetheine-binding protein [Gammaproteobacteria bacterium]